MVHSVARDSQEVANIVRELEEEMFNTEEQEYNKYCALLDKFSPLLHPHHYQLLILKRYLANSIRGNISLDMVEVTFGFYNDNIDISIYRKR